MRHHLYNNISDNHDHDGNNDDQQSEDDDQTMKQMPHSADRKPQQRRTRTRTTRSSRQGKSHTKFKMNHLFHKWHTLLLLSSCLLLILIHLCQQHLLLVQCSESEVQQQQIAAQQQLEQQLLTPPEQSGLIAAIGSTKNGHSSFNEQQSGDNFPSSSSSSALAGQDNNNNGAHSQPQITSSDSSLSADKFDQQQVDSSGQIPTTGSSGGGAESGFGGTDQSVGGASNTEQPTVLQQSLEEVPTVSGLSGLEDSTGATTGNGGDNNGSKRSQQQQAVDDFDQQIIAANGGLQSEQIEQTRLNGFGTLAGGGLGAAGDTNGNNGDTNGQKQDGVVGQQRSSRGRGSSGTQTSNSGHAGGNKKAMARDRSLKRASAGHRGVFGRKRPAKQPKQTAAVGSVSDDQQKQYGQPQVSDQQKVSEGAQQHHHYYYQTVSTKQWHPTTRSSLRQADFPDDYREILVQPDEQRDTVGQQVIDQVNNSGGDSSGANSTERKQQQQQVRSAAAKQTSQPQAQPQQQEQHQQQQAPDIEQGHVSAESLEQELGSGPQQQSDAAQVQQQVQVDEGSAAPVSQSSGSDAADGADQQKPYIKLSNVGTVNGTTAVAGSGTPTLTATAGGGGGGEVKLMRIYVIDLDQKLVVGNGSLLANAAESGAGYSTPATHSTQNTTSGGGDYTAQSAIANAMNIEQQLQLQQQQQEYEPMLLATTAAASPVYTTTAAPVYTTAYSAVYTPTSTTTTTTSTTPAPVVQANTYYEPQQQHQHYLPVAAHNHKTNGEGYVMVSRDALDANLGQLVAHMNSLAQPLEQAPVSGHYYTYNGSSLYDQQPAGNNTSSSGYLAVMPTPRPMQQQQQYYPSQELYNTAAVVPQYTAPQYSTPGGQVSAADSAGCAHGYGNKTGPASSAGAGTGAIAVAAPATSNYNHNHTQPQQPRVGHGAQARPVSDYESTGYHTVRANESPDAAVQSSIEHQPQYQYQQPQQQQQVVVYDTPAYNGNSNRSSLLGASAGDSQWRPLDYSAPTAVFAPAQAVAAAMAAKQHQSAYKAPTSTYSNAYSNSNPNSNTGAQTAGGSSAHWIDYGPAQLQQQQRPANNQWALNGHATNASGYGGASNHEQQHHLLAQTTASTAGYSGSGVGYGSHHGAVQDPSEHNQQEQHTGYGTTMDKGYVNSAHKGSASNNGTGSAAYQQQQVNEPQTPATSSASGSSYDSSSYLASAAGSSSSSPADDYTAGTATSAEAPRIPSVSVGTNYRQAPAGRPLVVESGTYGSQSSSSKHQQQQRRGKSKVLPAKQNYSASGATKGLNPSNSYKMAEAVDQLAAAGAYYEPSDSTESEAVTTIVEQASEEPTVSVQSHAGANMAPYQLGASYATQSRPSMRRPASYLLQATGAASSYNQQQSPTYYVQQPQMSASYGAQQPQQHQSMRPGGSYGQSTGGTRSLLSWETISSVASGAAKRLPSLSSILMPFNAIALSNSQYSKPTMYPTANAAHYAKSAHYERDVSAFHRPYPLRYMNTPPAAAAQQQQQQQQQQPHQQQQQAEAYQATDVYQVSELKSQPTEYQAAEGSEQTEADDQQQQSQVESVAGLGEQQQQQEQQQPAGEQQDLHSSASSDEQSAAGDASSTSAGDSTQSQVGPEAGADDVQVQQKMRPTNSSAALMAEPAPKPVKTMGPKAMKAAGKHKRPKQQLDAAQAAVLSSIEQQLATGGASGGDTMPLPKKAIRGPPGKHRGGKHKRPPSGHPIVEEVMVAAGSVPQAGGYEGSPQIVGPVPQVHSPTGVMYASVANSMVPRPVPFGSAAAGVGVGASGGTGVGGAGAPGAAAANGAPHSLQIGQYRITPQTQFMHSIIEPSRQMLGQYLNKYIGQLGQLGQLAGR